MRSVYLLSGQRVISCLYVLLVLSLHVLFKLLGGDLVVGAVVPAAAHHPALLLQPHLGGVHLHDGLVVLLNETVLDVGRSNDPGGELRTGPAALDAGNLGGGGWGGCTGSLWLIERMTREAVVAVFCLFPGVPITRIRQSLTMIKCHKLSHCQGLVWSADQNDKKPDVEPQLSPDHSSERPRPTGIISQSLTFI